MTQLTATQIKSYWNDGYLFPIRVMSQGDAAALRAELETLERDWLAADLPQPLNTYKRVNAHIVIPLAHQMGCHPPILDAVQGVLGPDIMLYSVEFFIKEPRTHAVATMHQDLTYWGMGAIDGLTTAWLALSPATPQSGCMDVVQGSHKNPILPHKDSFSANNLLSRGQEIRVDVAERDKVPVALNPGEISLHHGLTIHGSGPNRSDDRRIGVVIRYLRPDIVKTGGERDFAYLARGQDRHNLWEPTRAPSAPFTADALAAHAKIRNLQASVMMNGAEDSSAMYEKAP